MGSRITIYFLFIAGIGFAVLAVAYTVPNSTPAFSSTPTDTDPLLLSSTAASATGSQVATTTASSTTDSQTSTTSPTAEPPALPPDSQELPARTDPEEPEIEVQEVLVHTVPFYSQFDDITSPSWKKIGCGIASIAMLIDFYTDAVPVDTLLQEGITGGAYIKNAGWSHAGLIALAKNYGLTGTTVGLDHLGMPAAFSTLAEATEEGPVIASVHYTFDPQNPIPHLVVVTGVQDDLVYYNDPADKAGHGSVSIAQFKSAWKKRYIEIRNS